MTTNATNNTIGKIASRFFSVFRCFLAAALLIGAATASAQTPAPAPQAPHFDHASTGFTLIGKHAVTPCGTCHHNAVFKGTPKQCKLCHVAGNRYNTIGMSAAHIPTNEDCDTCHKADNPLDVAVMKHTQSMQNRCSNCHEAGSAFQGVDNLMTRPTRLTHPQKSFSGAVECGVCHTSTSAFAIVVPGSGMPNGHIPTNRPCGDCHVANTSNFSGAIMSHAGISVGCISCHQPGVASTVFVGVSVQGQGSHHLPTNAMACESCHSAAQAALYDATRSTSMTPSGGHYFGGGGAGGNTLMNHNGIGSCADCHQASATQFDYGTNAYTKGMDGIGGVSGISGTHIPTTQDCNTCHTSTTVFSGTHMNHAGVTTNCVSCHESGTFLGLARTSTFFLPRPATVNNANTGNALFTHPIGGDCSECHNSTTTWVTSMIPTGHIPIPSGVTCTSCHASGFAKGNEVMNHAGFGATRCDTCHGLGKDATYGSIGAAGLVPPLKTILASHIPVSGDCAGSGCHSSSSFTTFAGTTFGHNAASATISPCTACHESTTANATRQGQGTMVPTPTLVLRPPTPHTASDDCAKSGCHSATSFTTFVVTTGTFTGPLPAGHFTSTGMTTNCLACHTSGSYGPGSGVMNHTGIKTACANCHGKSFSITQVGGTKVTYPASGTVTGKLGNHVTTSAACETCHYTTNFGTFKGAPMNHTSITSGCKTCHDSSKVGTFQGYGFMIPSTDVKFKPGDSIHTNVVDCVPCHTSTTSFQTLSPTAATAALAAMTPPHFPITVAGAMLPCSNCHANFAVGSGLMSHTGITTACATCHGTTGSGTAGYKGVTIVTRSATHIPTSPATQACEVCHSAAVFSNFAGTKMVHTGITTGCQNCHENGTPSLSAFQGQGNMTPSANMVVRPINADHPTKAAVADCVPCHTSTTSFKTLAATLPSTALPTNHMPNPGNQACATCHGAGGNFLPGIMVHTGIAASACATCHNTGGSWIGIGTTVTLKTLSGLSPAHIPASTTCTNCHSASTFTTFAIAASKMSHSDATVLTKTCQSCHGVGTNTSYYLGSLTWFGQTSAHFSLSATPNCNTCHTKTTVGGFAGTAMNHTGVAACNYCHDVGSATATAMQGAANMTPTSPLVQRPTPANDSAHPTSGECGPTCHSTTPPFLGSVGAMPTGHISTSQPCTLCHAGGYSPTLTKMSHTGIVSGCATCHDVNSTNTLTTLTTSVSSKGTGIVTKLGAHVPTTSVTNGAVCETCHSTTNFTTFSGTAMKHTGIASSCQTCHNNGSAGTYQGSGNMTPTATVVQRPTSSQDPSHPAATGTGSNPDCVPCHTTNPPFTGTGGTMPPGHIPTVQPCSLCHTAGYAPGLTKMSHTGIANGCATCHDAGSTTKYSTLATTSPPLKMKSAVSPIHVPTTSVTGGTVCETCHSASNFTTFSGTAMKHTGITTGCTTCHGQAAGIAFQGVTPMYASQLGLHIGIGVASPGYVPASMDCYTCHTSTAIGGFMTGSKIFHSHVTVSGNCQICHSTAKAPGALAGTEKLTKKDYPHHSCANPMQTCDACHSHTTSGFP